MFLESIYRWLSARSAFAKPERRPARQRRPTTFKPALEHLEDRRLLSGFAVGAGSPFDDSNPQPWRHYGASATDNFGNVYVAGRFQGTANFSGKLRTSAGHGDAFVAKYTPKGNLLWVDRLGGKFDDQATGLAVDNLNHVYVTGTIGYAEDPQGDVYANAFVAKLNAGTGTVFWQKQASGLNSGGGGIAVDRKGNVYTTGNFDGTTNFFGQKTLVGKVFNEGNSFLVKQNPAGQIIWISQFGTTFAGPFSDSAGRSVAVDSTGTNIYVAGAFRGTVDLGVAGFNSDVHVGQGTTDIFVEKFNQAGKYVWASQAGSATVLEGLPEAAFGITLDRKGNPCVTGEVDNSAMFPAHFGALVPPVIPNGGPDVFVTKLDKITGAFTRVQLFGNMGNTFGRAIAADGQGNLYVTGGFQGAVDFGGTVLVSNGGFDAFVVKLSDNPAIPPRATHLGGPGDDAGAGIAADHFGPHIDVTGAYEQVGQFPPFGPLTSAGGNDIFVERFELK
jgi:hypothetical protein